MWKGILVNKLMELAWVFNLIPLAVRSPDKGIFKADDFKNIQVIIRLAL